VLTGPDLWPTAIHSSGLPFNDRHPHNPCNYMDYYSLPTSEGWKAELTWLVDPQQTLYPKSGHMSTTGQA